MKKINLKKYLKFLNSDFFDGFFMSFFILSGILGLVAGIYYLASWSFGYAILIGASVRWKKLAYRYRDLAKELLDSIETHNKKVEKIIEEETKKKANEEIKKEEGSTEASVG